MLYSKGMEIPRLISPALAEEQQLLLELLERAPAQNLFMLGVLEDFRTGRLREPVYFYGLPGQGALEGSVMISERGLWVPWVRDLEVARRLGRGLRHLPLLSALGERAAVDALWTGYSEGWSSTWSASYGTPSNGCWSSPIDEMDLWVNPHLRLAVEADLEQVVEASALMQLADLGQDPRMIDAGAPRHRCLETDPDRARPSWSSTGSD